MMRLVELLECLGSSRGVSVRGCECDAEAGACGSLCTSAWLSLSGSCVQTP
jgi:hypothetical protein